MSVSIINTTHPGGCKGDWLQALWRFMPLVSPFGSAEAVQSLKFISSLWLLLLSLTKIKKCVKCVFFVFFFVVDNVVEAFHYTLTLFNTGQKDERKQNSRTCV